MEKNVAKEIQARIFHIVQRVKNEETGKELLTENKIIQALGHKTIKEWAYILHDKDVDENGKTKTAHWHIVLNCPSKAKLKSISEWFGVAENFIDIPKGRGAFGDCVAYLTHEEVREEKKHIYEHEEVKANFDVKKFFERRFEERKRFGKTLSEEEKIIIDVMEKGKTLSECRVENPLFYANNLRKLQMLRNDYLSKLEPPNLRINIYITGKGGIGKDLLSQAIARSFFPNYEYDEDIYFNVGSKGSAFEGYDGQPVIIWSDRRAIDLIMELNGRGNVFDVFDSHPRKARQNVKYSSIALNNSINIINAVEPYEDFLNGLSGEYIDKQGEKRKGEDKRQSYRRFPIILELDIGVFEMLVNKGWLCNDDAFLQYIAYGRFRMGLKEVAEKCGKNRKIKRMIEEKTTKPIKEIKEKFEEQYNKEYSDEELLEMFKDSGEKINDDEFIKVSNEKIPFDE